MGIAMFDAVGLAKRNKAKHEALVAEYDALQSACMNETGAQEQERRKCQDQALEPFKTIFVRLRNVDLAELAAFDALPSGELPAVDVLNVRLSAAGALGALAGGAATGAAVGATTFAAVGAFAAASTGTAISTLSGAAATSATLAWLGGGSVAAGGGGVAAGTTVLAGLVAAPVVLALGAFFEFKGRQQRRKQEETAAELRKAEAELKLSQSKSKPVLKRSAEVRKMLKALRKELTGRLPAFELLVAENDNYDTYDPAERRLVAEAVALSTSIVTVMATPFVDEAGIVTDLSAAVLTDAKTRLAASLAA